MSRPYEGLFLVDEGKASDNAQAVLDHIRGLLERHGGSIETLEKWDSRRLAYEVQGKRRGVYFLARFDGDPTQIAALERDCRISNVLLRTMIVRAESTGISLAEAEDKRRTARAERERAKEEAAQPDTEPPAEDAPAKDAPAEDAPADAEAPADPPESATAAPEPDAAPTKGE